MFCCALWLADFNDSKNTLLALEQSPDYPTDTELSMKNMNNMSE